MARLRIRLFLLAFIICAAAVPHARAQRPEAPNVIQIFMPNGAQPDRVMRFTLTRDDGRIETVFTDSKGKYSMASDIAKATGYTVVVETDRQTYDTTTTTFRVLRATDSVYVSVYLRPLKSPAVPRAQVIDAAQLDAGAPADAQAAYREGMELIVKGQTDAGVEGLKRALTLHPRYARALNDLGAVYMAQNRLEEAADAFTRALQISPRFQYARLNLGITLDRQGKYQEAVSALEPLYRENPALAGVRTSYADALYDAGRLDDARKVLRAGLDDATLGRPARAELHYKIGRVLSREEKSAEAVKELRLATSLEPTAFNAHLLLGGSLLALKRAPEAERSLLRAYELGGARAGHAQLLLGELYFEQKRFDLSLRAFEQYLRDVPDARNAAQIRDVVARLQASPK